MSTRDYSKDHYELEAARRSDLTNALSLPLGVVTLLIGALAVIAQATPNPLASLSIAKLLVIAVAVMFVLHTAYFLTRSLYNYEYGYTPTAQELREYRDGLVTYYSELGEPPDIAITKAEAEALEHLDSQYAVHAHRNRQSNNQKSSYLHRANGALISATVSTLLAGLLFVISSIEAGQLVPEIRVVNLSEINMTSPQTPTPSAPQPTTTEQRPTSVPVKPTAPPGQVLKEHRNPTKQR